MKRTAGWALALMAAVAAAPSVTAAHAETPPPRSFEFTYQVAVESIPPGAKSIAVWVPVPQSDAHQTIENLRVTGAPDHRFEVDDKFGNKFLIVNVKPGTEHASFEVVFDATRQARRNLDGDAAAVAVALENKELYLTPTSMVRTDGPIAEEARKVVGSETDPLAQARALYDHIVNTVEYDKSGEGWGRGDTTYACDVRKGNCTDFHSLFIGEAIAIGLPARFLMGFSVPNTAPSGEIGGYHCWAEFHLEGRGWIPIDASEAFKDPARRDELFGGLDADRVEFTLGRDIPLPGMQGAPLNYSIYPYAEVDGQPHTAIQKKFLYRELN